MSVRLPTPIPQVPVRDLERAISFYQSLLGFSLDWKHEHGIAGVSCGDARLFLDRILEGPVHPVRIWLNLNSVSEVDALHRDWTKSGVPVSSPPEQKPWGLYEFIAQDCDDNSFRIFYDTETPTKKD
jgi:predicted enzyme related to lactoylglutathione lyase